VIKADIEKAKEILIAHRPNRPQKTENRQLQKAIDVALELFDNYELYQKIIDASEVKIER